MFDIGWSELILIGTVALIVVGPKDLPDMFRQLGRFTSKARSMAREFSSAMEDAAKDTGVHDVANDLRKVASPKSLGLDAVRNAATKFENWDPMRAMRTASEHAKVVEEQIRHSAASVTAAPPAAETLRPPAGAMPAGSGSIYPGAAAPKPIDMDLARQRLAEPAPADPKPARARPEPVRRRKLDAAAPMRKPVPRKPLPKKRDP